MMPARNPSSRRLPATPRRPAFTAVARSGARKYLINTPYIFGDPVCRPHIGYLRLDGRDRHGHRPLGGPAAGPALPAAAPQRHRSAAPDPAAGPTLTPATGETR